jgi:hypothetical protein
MIPCGSCGPNISGRFRARLQLSDLLRPGLKLASLLVAIAIVSPVRGLRPLRAFFPFTTKLPKPSQIDPLTPLQSIRNRL